MIHVENSLHSLPPLPWFNSGHNFCSFQMIMNRTRLLDSKAIVDGNLKLILGLIWTLILHYSISMPMWDEEEEADEGRQKTPKQRLLGWIQNKLPELPITNFSKDWQTGQALGALVDSCAPGLCPDWDSWDQTKPVENAREAMQQADDWLGIPQVITPEEIVDPNVDEHSVMTYLSQFPKAKLKPGAPLRPKLNPKKARAYGPGIEPVGNVVMKKATFTVETISAGMGEVLVYVEDPAGHREEGKVTANNDKNRTYSVVYTPKVTGMHKVTVLFAGQHISKSPFEVEIGMAQGDSSKATAQGPGLEPTGNIANKTTYFDVYTAGGGGDHGSSGEEEHGPCTIEDKGNSSYRCTYKPTQEGAHTIFITFAGGQISKSPFTVTVGEACNPSLCKAKGRGLQPKGLRVKETADFRVYTKGAGTGELKVSIKGPKGLEEPCKRKDLGDGVYGFEYFPSTPGTYIITITWGGQHIPRSPIEVKIGAEAGQQKVRAWGPGLEGGVVGKSADFVVEAVGDNVGTLGFSVEGPSQAKIECDDKGDGSCDVRYWPTEAGEYAVHVLCNNEDIQHSPFMAEVVNAPGKDFYPDKVKAYGPGLQSNGLAVGKPTEFTVDAKQGGKAPLKITAQDGEGNPMEVQVKDNGNGTYSCSYTPKKPVKHTVMVSWGGVNIPDSPFRMNIGAGCHPNKVKVSGPGVSKTGLKAFEPTYFTVDCAEAGQGDISIGIKCAPGVVGPAEADIDFDIIRNDNDTFTVKYTPPGAGNYTIMVLFATRPTRRRCDVRRRQHPKSPFNVAVAPTLDLSKVSVTGLGDKMTVGKDKDVTVKSKGAGGQGKVAAKVTGPAGKPIASKVEPGLSADVAHVKFIPREAGPYQVELTYDGVPIPGLLQPHSLPGNRPIQGVYREATTDFTVDARALTQSGGDHIKTVISNPSGARTDALISDRGDGTYDVEYTPYEEGLHSVEVCYDGSPVPQSPFRVVVTEGCDPTRVRVHGPGLKSGITNKPNKFTVETRGAGTGGLGLAMEGPSEAKMSCTDNKDGSCSVEYIPYEPELTTSTSLTTGSQSQVRVSYDRQPITGQNQLRQAANHSPYKVKVLPTHDASKVKCSGPGLNTTGVPASLPVEFTIDAKDAGEGLLAVQITDPEGKPKKAEIRDNHDGTYLVSYVPDMTGRYTILIKYGGDEIPYSPYRIRALPTGDASKCMVTVSIGGHGLGAGMGPTIQIGEQTVITVDAKAAGKGKVTCSVFTPEGAELDVDVVENEDGTFDIFYTAPQPGEYVICVRFGGEHIPNSPFQVTALEGAPSDPLLQQSQMPQYYAQQPWVQGQTCVSFITLHHSSSLLSVLCPSCLCLVSGFV
ncbi:hypothetical protein WMY93_006863 [Mugilogobius chulae]|uniref:Calponin-homology (CH) domain-containing protein n=1 Tax=Mugilogobius chulae TaxID=88201 RepID=A0AAW0Q0S7_9GOBI